MSLGRAMVGFEKIFAGIVPQIAPIDVTQKIINIFDIGEIL